VGSLELMELKDYLDPEELKALQALKARLGHRDSAERRALPGPQDRQEHQDHQDPEDQEVPGA